MPTGYQGERDMSGENGGGDRVGSKRGRYDPITQMFIEDPGEVSIKWLIFLRRQAKLGRLEHVREGDPSGDYYKKYEYFLPRLCKVREATPEQELRKAVITDETSRLLNGGELSPPDRRFIRTSSTLGGKASILDRLRFLRWMAEKGKLEHEVAGASTGEFVVLGKLQKVNSG